MIARLSLYLFAVTLFTSCLHNDAHSNRNPELAAFPVEKKIREEQLLNVNKVYPDFIDLYNDSILCFVNGTGDLGYHVAFYDLTAKSFLHPQLPVGSKSGQALSFHSYGIENNYLWCHDFNQQKLIFTRLDNLRDSSASHFLKDITVPGMYYSAQLLNDSTLLGNGDYYFRNGNDYQLSTIDLINGKTTNQLARYASDSSTHYNLAQKMAYESLLFVKPSKDKAVIACRYSDRIEVVDLHTGKLKLTWGPQGFNPEMKVVPRGNRKISTPGPDTRQAFVRGEVTNKYIYLLYSGYNEGTKHLFFGQYIYVYDWDGNPVQKLELKDEIEDFAVASNDSLLYTFNPRSKFISVAKLTN